MSSPSDATPYLLMLFPSTHQAMVGEDVLRAAGLWLQVVPAPKEFTSGCGLAIRVTAADRERAVSVLTASSVRFILPGASGVGEID